MRGDTFGVDGYGAGYCMVPYSNQFIYRSDEKELTIYDRKTRVSSIYDMEIIPDYFYADKRFIYIIRPKFIFVYDLDMHFVTALRLDKIETVLGFCEKETRIYAYPKDNEPHQLAKICEKGHFHDLKTINIPKDYTFFAISEDIYTLCPDMDLFPRRPQPLIFKNIKTDETVYQQIIHTPPFYLGCGYYLVCSYNKFYIINHKGVLDLIPLKEVPFFRNLKISFKDDGGYTFWSFDDQTFNMFE